MSRLLASDLEPLLEARPGPCISLYFSTFHPSTRTPQGPIRLKSLLARTTTDLRARGLDEATIETLLQPLADLPAEAPFWNTRDEGVALFCAPGFTRAFRLSHAFAERCTVGPHFFVKPLLPLVAGDDAFCVLALSQNEVRLLEAAGRSVRRLASRELPRNLVDALGEQKVSREIQYHSSSSAPAGARPPTFHGRGADQGTAKEELNRYLRRVEAATRKLLTGQTVPLVLAGAAPLPAIYREINGYPHLAVPVIPGNPDLASDEELCDRARQLLEPGFHEARRRAAERFAALAGTGRASSDVKEILPAARHGRVEALFLACDVDLWGQLDRTEEVEVHQPPERGDEELLDEAALFSLRNGGAVFGLARGEVPGGGDLAAIFRY